MTTSNPNPLAEQLRQLAAADPGLLDKLTQTGSPEAALQHMAEASARTGLPIDLEAARAAMMQALGSAEPMSDDALESLAGGQVNIAKVLASIASWGIVCAGASIIEAAMQRDCGAIFHLSKPQ